MGQTQNEDPIAIVPNGKIDDGKMDENDLESLLLKGSHRLQAILARSHQSIQQGKGLTADEFWQSLE